MSKPTGKVAVIIGTSKGIGGAVAKTFAEGALVVVNYASSRFGANRIVDEIAKASGQAVAAGGDVSKPAETQGIIAAAIQHLGRLDILANNWGYTSSSLSKQSQRNFFTANLTSTCSACCSSRKLPSST